jgi:type IV pilus assembly protein PilA
MQFRSRSRSRVQCLRCEDGFTLIELLVVILIIGILAAIAIPSFLAQRGKASDAAAKSLIATAETAANTYGLDSAAGYVSMSAASLVSYEATIQITSGGGNAYISSVSDLSVSTYEITATSTSGDTFSVIRAANGVVTRSCTGTAQASGCVNGSW